MHPKNKNQGVIGDELMRPSIYGGKISTYMNKARDVFNGIADDKNTVEFTKYLRKHEDIKDTVNIFWRKYQYASQLLNFAYAEERLSQAYAENFDKLGVFKENITKYYNKLAAHAHLSEDSGAFVKEAKWLSNKPECVKPEGEYICHDEIKRISKELLLELILPAIILVNIDEKHNAGSAVSASIEYLKEPAIIATLEAFKTRKAFTTGRSDFTIYYSIIQNAKGESIINNQAFLDFLCDYSLHYNRLDSIQHILYCNKGEAFVKEENNTLEIGNVLSATIICGGVKKLSVQKRTFIINEKRRCEELK